jgi:hypothetical protein
MTLIEETKGWVSCTDPAFRYENSAKTTHAQYLDTISTYLSFSLLFLCFSWFVLDSTQWKCHSRHLDGKRSWHNDDEPESSNGVNNRPTLEGQVS